MEAAVLLTAPGNLDLEDVEIDDPMADEVLVRTVACGLCHTDVVSLDGKQPTRTPAVLGHEPSGIVEAVGKAVTHVRPGDHVVACASGACGVCEYCGAGRPHLCDGAVDGARPKQRPKLMLDGNRCFGLLGGFAEQMLLHERNVVRIRDEMPLDRAALFGCGFLTGMGAVVRTAKVPSGATVAVMGCGGVGLSCVHAAALAGASAVVAIDTIPAKLELAMTLGATEVIDASIADPIETVRARFPGTGHLGVPGGGVEYGFEAVGSKVAAEATLAMVRKGGTFTMIGWDPLGVIEVSCADLMNEKRVQGSYMGSNRFRQDIPRYVDMYLQGRLNLDALISTRLSLNEINDGFAALRRGAVARALLVFEQ